MTHKNIVVTGATGFLGSHATRVLSARGFDVLPCAVDIRDAQALATFSKSCPESSILLHFAGMSFPPDCERNPHLAHELNCTGAENVFNALHSKLSQFVFFSSAQVYQSDEGGGVSEESLVNPINEYSKSKVAGEKAVMACSKAFGVPVTILRLFNFTHKSQAYDAFLPRVYRTLQQMKSNSGERRILRVGNLDLIRDFSPLQDFLSALVCLTENQPKGSRIYNVASGSGKSLRILLQLLFERLEIHPELDFDQRLLRKEPQVVIGDSSRFQNDFGWRPTGLTEAAVIDGFLADL